MEPTTTAAAATDLTGVFARIQGMLLSHESAQAAAAQLAEAARDLIDTAAGAGVSLIDETGNRTTTAATDRLAETADAAQYELGQGPCLSAWATESLQRLDDTTTDTRWPEWSRTAADAGIGSVLSAPVLYRETCLGAMKIYATTAHAFSTRAEHQLVLLASAAGTLLGAAQGSDAPQRLSASLQQAIADRTAVETATGMLMERHATDHEAARRTLIDASRAQGRPLAQIARQVVERAADTTS
ncbi:GAF and ANTAR domain-containing protein [Kocuria aegyptia]|uniref:GAF and ANTAR domain-containing protein n=1 Tax=Kocuria aegyptia TaxID=330943 RepID=A0ABP4WDB3_9MICC